MEENKNAYSEVIEILKLIEDEKKLEALPIEMLEVLKSKSNPDYKPQISMKIPLDEQNLQPQTLGILSWIASKYWNEILENDFVEENNVLKEDEKSAIQDEIHTEDEIEENIEENNISESKEETKTELPIIYRDLKWYQKIRIRIIEIFNKIFKKNKSKIEEGNA